MYQPPPGFAVVTVSLTTVHRLKPSLPLRHFVTPPLKIFQIFRGGVWLTRELFEVPLKFLRKFQRESFFSYWVI